MSEHAGTRRPLGRREALELMASAPLGRVVVSEGALPAVYLVPFALDRDHVVFRAPLDSRLAKAARDAVVAFQADRVDPSARTGWTATVTGQASLVRDPAAVARLDGLVPTSGAREEGQAWFRVTTELVTGHLIPEPPGPRTHAEADAAPRSAPPSARSSPPPPRREA
ncbi:pyridoxamine 5'-phosphate oxidase family protein [Embleya sp. NPDC001921]